MAFEFYIRQTSLLVLVICLPDLISNYTMANTFVLHCRGSGCLYVFASTVCHISTLLPLDIV